MKLNLLSVLAILFPLGLADITFTTPAAGASLTGAGAALSAVWTNTGSPVFTTYTLSLCAGGNTEGTWIPLIDLVTNGQFANGNTAQGVVTAAIGSSTVTNAYFLKLVATGTTGSATYFSSRFSLTGMTGTFTAAVLAGAKAVTGTAGPANVDNTKAAAASDAGVPQYTVAFADQIGLTRWAPMMVVPPTKMTKKVQTPLHPTSSITGYATGPLPIPTIMKTVTQSQTFSVSSRENTVAPAGMPTDMAKFLARWVD